jgi:pimeloyl-ACP methyl ester carboxylesterase
MTCQRVIAAFVVAVSLAGCAQYSTVKIKRPHYQSETPIGQVIGKAYTDYRRKPLAALGGFLTAAETASRQLQRNPRDDDARRDYNFAVGRIIGIIHDAKLDPWTQPLRVPSSSGEFVLTHKPDSRPEWNPALYDFTPADQFDIHGVYVKKHTTRDGIGAAVVAVGREINMNSHTTFSLPRIIYGVTAVARFEGRRCVLAFEDPLAAETTHFGGRIHPLAADFTAPVAVMLASYNPKKFKISSLLHPAKYTEIMRIARLQPYDPNKAVVLVIHGLMDTPATWTPMINTLCGYADMRRNYQVWFYGYPSGYPYPYTAGILRHELDAVDKKFSLRKKLVVIGHSMGGCVSRLLITDTGDKLWMNFFKTPPEKTPMSPENKKLFTEALIFKHRSEVGRVIFISAPLRGSELASNWLGRIGSILIRSPASLCRAGNEAIKATNSLSGDVRLGRIPNSVDTLEPNNPFVKAINTIPITPGIPYHVICGDRGKGNGPKSSDGIVPYWSSHMEGAKSECIVPSGHGAHQNPKAIEEVHRILLINAGQSHTKISLQNVRP